MRGMGYRMLCSATVGMLSTALCADTTASSDTFVYFAAGEAVTSAISAEAAVFQASGSALAENGSASFVYYASGDAIAAKSSPSCAYRAVGETVAFGTTCTFVYVAAGESWPSELVAGHGGFLQSSVGSLASNAGVEGSKEESLQTTDIKLTNGAVTMSLRAHIGDARKAIDMTALRVQYWRRLGAEPVLLEPQIKGVAEDGDLILEVEVPAGESGFLQPVVL